MEFRKYRVQLKKILNELMVDFSKEDKPLKASIVTWCNNNGPTNYGQVLQCYATQQLLADMGIKAITVLYQNTMSRVEESDFKRVCRFQEFINGNVAVTKPCLTKEMVEEETKDSVLLVCGSDQIWNPVYFDPVYFLDFGNDRQKRLALSVSGVFYRSNANDMYYKRMAQFIEKMDFITIRERIGVDILEQFSSKEMSVFPDPTLLLSEKEWKEKAKDSVYDYGDTEYVFCYILGRIHPYLSEIEKLEETYKTEVVRYIPSNVNIEHIDELEAMYGCGPAEFLNLIMNSKAVLTDSFHGVVFSLIFKKPVFCAERINFGQDIFGGKARIQNLQEEYGIKLKWINSVENKLVSNDSKLIENIAQIKELGNQIYLLQKHKSWIMPSELIKEKSRVVVYGYGDVGKDYCAQILRERRCQLVAVIDSDYDRKPLLQFPIYPIEKLQDLSFDIIIIAIVDYYISKEIRKNLIRNGVSDDRILWFNPLGQKHN